MRPAKPTMPALLLLGSVLALGGCGGAAEAPTLPSDQAANTAAGTATEAAEAEEAVVVARADIAGPDGTPHGTVEFREAEGGLRVVVDARGLEPGFKGLHLHAVGQCAADSQDPKDASKKGDFLSAGGHLGTGRHPDHQGDLPPLLVGKNGAAQLEVRTDRVDADAILDQDGTAVVVHGGPDNLGNIPTRYSATGADEQTGKAGDAGDRVACGVVEAP